MTCSAHPDVEGGYYLHAEAVGHTFPTYTEPGSDFDSQRSNGMRLKRYWLRVVRQATLRRANSTTAVIWLWSLRWRHEGTKWLVGRKRYLNFHDPRQLRHELLLTGLVTITLISIGAVLSLSFRLQRGFREIGRTCSPAIGRKLSTIRPGPRVASDRQGD